MYSFDRRIFYFINAKEILMVCLVCFGLGKVWVDNKEHSCFSCRTFQPIVFDSVEQIVERARKREERREDYRKKSNKELETMLNYVLKKIPQSDAQARNNQEIIDDIIDAMVPNK